MTDAVELKEFRNQSRAWLEENCPDEMRQSVDGADDECGGGTKWRFSSPAQKQWLEVMAERGWTVPSWPQEYGGGGLTPDQEKILYQEMDRVGARLPLKNFGISMLGPVLLKYGSDAQKKQYLPEIAQGEVRWCQGYSEPGAGSDLASIKTKAIDRGDYFEVTGQKIWTSYADECDRIFCLVRTDPNASKHRGITFLLIDMDDLGVSTRPIKLISGKSPFCETFIDAVKVPKSNVVGEINKGWSVAKYLLVHERETIGALPSDLGNRPLVTTVVDAVGLDESGRLKDKLLRAEMIPVVRDSWALNLTIDRLRGESAMGEAIGSRSAMLKYCGSELNKQRYELMARAVASGGLSEDNVVLREWLRSKGNSIEGGTSEVMLNIISKTILNLPVS